MGINPTLERLGIMVIGRNLYVINLEKLYHEHLDVGKV